MRKNIQFALRNIFRNKRRSLITIIAIAFGVFIMIISLSYVAGLYNGMVDVAINTGVGHLQIHHMGYLEAIEDRTLSTKHFLSETEMMSMINKPEINSHIDKIAKRLSTSGLVSNGIDTTYGLVLGVDPEIEKNFFTSLRILDGEPLKQGSINEIIINKRIRKVFNVKIGDILTIASQTVDGFLNAADYIVVGVFDPGTKFNFRYMVDVFMSIADTKSLIYSKDTLTEIAIKVKDINIVDSIVSQFEEYAGNNNIEIEIHSWKYIAKLLLDIAIYIKAGMRGWTAILFIVIVLLIVNAFLMSVYERTNEIGILMAVGTKRKSIRNLFFLESLLLGLIASAAGFLVSTLVINILSFIGLPPMVDFLPEGQSVHPSVEFMDTIISLAISVCVSGLAGLFPAIKASKMNPVDALRYE